MTLDPVARLIVEESGPVSGRVLVVDDVGGSLTRWAADLGADVRAWCDDLRESRLLPPQTALADLAAPPDGWRPDLVWWRLPRAVSEVEDLAERLALLVAPDGRVVAGARTRHMTPAQNVALARSFTTVRASLGRDKSRVLHASGPKPTGALRWPRSRVEEALGLTVVAHGQVFATNRLDAGTRLLLQALEAAPAPERGQRALDLGCGSGIIASWLARRGWAVTATDVSASAVASAALTARANGLTVDARQSVGLEALSPGSVDLIACNPPFHQGAAKDSTPTLALLREAGTALAPGGHLWVVYNSHLPYLAELHRTGPTRIVARDRHYTVTRTTRLNPGGFSSSPVE